MLFISLVKFTRKLKKGDTTETDRIFADQAKTGIKTIAVYWTLGRYDAVRIFEGPDEKTVMKVLAKAPEGISTETLVAVKREDAIKLLE